MTEDRPRRGHIRGAYTDSVAAASICSMFSTLIYLTALATAAVAQEPWRYLQWNPDPLAPYTDSSNFFFPTYIVGKYGHTYQNGDSITL